MTKVEYKEDYISFETAKLLKEKGFDEDIDLWYDENGEMFSRHKYDISSDWRVRAQQKVYLCPTLQMAMKWLREVHDLHIEITSMKPYGSDGNGHEIPLDGVEYHSNIVQNNKWADIIKKFKSHSIACYRSYEEACETAIKYCLENLI